MNRLSRYFHGYTLASHEDYRIFRKFIRDIYAQKPTPEPISLMECARYCYDDTGETYTEFGFLPDHMNSWGDEAIQEYVNDLREYVSSPYDCSGQRFTRWIHWHRNPCGRISVVHRLGIDV